MKVFVVSKYGSSQELARKLIQENHSVLMFIRDKVARSINTSKFLINNPIEDDIEADLFIVEDNYSGKFVERIKTMNRPIIGGGILSDKLSKSEEYHNKVVTGCGFSLATNDTKGMPITLGGWFTGSEFIRPYLLGVRYHRVGTGEVGHTTKGMGFVAQYKLKGKIFNLLRKMETLLRTANYRGFVSLKLLINNESAKVKQLDLGLNFPEIATVSSIHGVVGEFLLKLATNGIKQVPVQPDLVGAGVVWLPNIDQATICPKMPSYSGSTVEEAVNKVYKEIRKLGNDDAYYRVDIGYNYNICLTSLKKWEWI